MEEKKAEKTESITIPLTDYVSIQLTTFDDEIAAQEVIKAQANLAIAQLKKKKTEAIINFHHDRLTKQIDAGKKKKEN
jgi:hypothetical protein